MTLEYRTNKEIRWQLRILGYTEGTVEWDGALAAARVHAERLGLGLHKMTDEMITIRREDAKHLFDLAVDTPLVCSGSFDTDDVVVLRKLAGLIGVDPAKATPSDFVRDFPHAFEPFNVGIERMERRDDAAPGGIRWETDEEVYARLGESPDWCVAGDYNRRCRRPANDPIHAAARETAEMGVIRPAMLVSIDGEPFAPGSLTVESDGRLLDWRGDAAVFLKPGRTVRVVVVTDHAVYFGDALLNVGTMPPLDGDEPPVSGFMGHGELHRKDLREVADMLFATVAEGAR